MLRCWAAIKCQRQIQQADQRPCTPEIDILVRYLNLVSLPEVTLSVHGAGYICVGVCQGDIMGHTLDFSPGHQGCDQESRFLCLTVIIRKLCYQHHWKSKECWKKRKEKKRTQQHQQVRKTSPCHLFCQPIPQNPKILDENLCWTKLILKNKNKIKINYCWIANW